jgi:hypothetical protein
MKFLNAVLVAGAFSLAAGASQAATYTLGDDGVDVWNALSASGACDSIADIDPDAKECAGFFNVKNDVADPTKAPKEGFVDVNYDYFFGEAAENQGLFGGGWSEVAKFEDGAVPDITGNLLTLADVNALAKSWGEIAIGFKQGGGNPGSEWAAYLLDGAEDFLSGTYNVARFSNTGLSHMTIWGRGEPVVCEGDDCGGGHTPIPLPAAGWLLLGGLGGLAAMRRRNKV